MRRNGWIKAARTQASLDREIAEAKAYAEYGIACEILDSADLHAREPHLGEGRDRGRPPHRSGDLTRSRGGLTKGGGGLCGSVRAAGRALPER